MSALPPYAEVLGLVLVDDGRGARMLRMPFGDHLLGRPDFIHGGAIAGLLEMAAVLALREALGDEDLPRLKPINVTVNFMRGGRGLDCFAAGRVTRLGKRIANVSAEAWQADRDRPIAAAQLNLLLDRNPIS